MTPARPALGLVLGSSQSPQDILTAATAAELAGLDELWLGEDYFFTGAFATAATLLAVTRLPVGIGIVPATTRHPGVTAMEIATLAGLHPGRLRAGVGLGVPEWLDAMELRPRSPLGAIRDTLRGLRTLLRGDPLDGGFSSFAAHAITLEHPPAVPPPLYAGVGGPKALRLAAAEADGTVLSVLAGPRYVRWARERLTEAGAPAGHRVVVYALCAIDDDRDAARDALRELFGLYLLSGPRNPMTEVQGVADRAEELAALGFEAAIPEIPDEWIDRLAVVGTPDDCARGIAELAEAGADTVALAFPPGLPIGLMAERLAKDVIPMLGPARETR
ncbi:LLM class flavin-dependent oxidoreductase [Streptosporangium sp. NPDC051022]|uniref:LLM class flavin-dependent oxidoreductase n=1 Tax=Streptosporangium sp. NPDC051022 TaxID=3155752 RepID=UPI003433E35D